jgi:hypothetical protein
MFRELGSSYLQPRALIRVISGLNPNPDKPGLNIED